jgi:hypothetical protein
MKLSEWNRFILFIIFLIIIYIITIHFCSWGLHESFYKIINNTFGGKIIEGADTFMAINPVNGIDYGEPLDLNQNNGGDWADQKIPDAEIVLATKGMHDAIDKVKKAVNDFGKTANSVVDGLNKIAKAFGAKGNSIPSVPEVKIPDPPNPKIPMKPVRNALRSISNRLMDAINNVIPEWFHRTFEVPVEEKINIIKDVFANITRRLQAIGDGFMGMHNGVGEQWDGFSFGIADAFDNLTSLIHFTGSHIGTKTQCGIKFINGFGGCWYYYFIDIIAQSIYSLLSFPILFGMSTVGVDSEKYEKSFWKWAKHYDNKYLFNKYGFGLTQWPLFIQEDCYLCGTITLETIEKKAEMVEKKFKTGIKDAMQKGVNTFNKGAYNIKNAFDSKFK